VGLLCLCRFWRFLLSASAFSILKAQFMRQLSDKVVDQNCGISPRLEVSRVGGSQIGSIETACPTALRLAMWEEHGIQPAAQFYLDTEVTRLRHAGSYSCRKIRNSSGGSDRWSTHARAMAIDITGFDLADGSRIRLINDWNGSQAEQTFLRAHLQSTGWGTCR